MSTSGQGRASGEAPDGASGEVVHEDVPDIPFNGGDPDVGFTLGDANDAAAQEVSTQPTSVAEQARTLAHRIARDLVAQGPQGWRRLQAVFAFTVAAEAGQVVFRDDAQRSAQGRPADSTVALVREHRQISARMGDGPWWRMTLTLDSGGELTVDYDYGDEPFPDDQLFAPHVYRADLAAFPRRRVPVWLAAYVGHEDRQSRTPAQAAQQARHDRDAGIQGVRTRHDLPDFPVLWARWAVIAAAFVAVGSDRGPRIMPALAWFEGAGRSGSTLSVVPGGRAVLSGGVWNAPELDAAYNQGAPLPALYEGAPAWVANPVLNPRISSGLLSFCYWWEGGSWHRGQSPAAQELASAVPGIWTDTTVVDVVAGLSGEQPTQHDRDAVAALVSAAQAHVVTRESLSEVFPEDGKTDLDSAFHQLMLAGVALAVPEPLSQSQAVARVRRHILDKGMDTAGYPLDRLRAQRFSVGWMVYVPTEPGEIVVGRAIFYLADDGVLEQSSSSIAPQRYSAEFEQRYHQRNPSAAAESLT